MSIENESDDERAGVRILSSNGDEDSLQDKHLHQSYPNSAAESNYKTL